MQGHRLGSYPVRLYNVTIESMEMPFLSFVCIISFLSFMLDWRSTCIDLVS